ncbi:hypothetical protein ABPG74_011846 [Tetrahymena malaccensis]
MEEAPHLNEDQLNEIYSWVDSIPLSRPKKNIARDFSDGVLMAEVVAHCIPRLVELHNYSAANSVKQKYYNWETLNKKVFSKLGLLVSKTDITNIVECKPEVIERVLKLVKNHIEAFNSDPQNFSPEKSQKSFNQIKRSGAPMDRGNNKFQNQDNQFQQSQQDEIIWEKDQTINELRETIEILELKMKKLEDLIKLKDNKIVTLQNRMAEHGLY